MKNKEYGSRAPVKILVLDILKPHSPSILELGQIVCHEKSVDNGNLSVYAVDEKTESIKMTLEGKNINYVTVKDLIEEQGAVIHSMDRVVLGTSPIVDLKSIAAEVVK